MELSRAQKQVIDTQEKSLLVSASAGSGKTFVVIQRIIESIKQGADVSRLLVLTFTNAAASELKERLVSALNTLKDEYIEKGDTKNARRITKQISRIPMADISTIHSFCLNIIRNNFYSLGIDPNVTTLEATKSTIMISEVINEVLEEQFEEGKQEFTDILDILGNENNLADIIYRLYSAYRNVLENDVWLDNIKSMYNTKLGIDLSETEFGQVILANVKNRLKLLKIELESTIDMLDALDDFESRQAMLKRILNCVEGALETQKYDELYNYLPNLLNIPRLPSSKVTDEQLKEQVKEIKDKSVKEFKDIAHIIYKDSEGIINELNESLKYINWYIDVIKQVDQKYTTAKYKKCAIDFADYEHLALSALKDENTTNKYKEKYDYIYVDEYQDTSYAQEAIIQKIAKSNNVIMVGDVKQSIYAFRNAKPELFTNKYETLKEVEEQPDSQSAKIILAQNFRSRKQVLESINDIFTVLMSKDFGGTRYEDKEALVYGEGYDCSLNQNYKTEINIIEKDYDIQDDVEYNQDAVDSNINIEDIQDIEIEASHVAKKIRELVDNKFQVYDLKKKEYRDIQYKDIVILLRTVEGKADKVANVLAKFDVPCFADSKTGFYKSEEITLVTSFLKVLDNPYDDIALVSIMYSIIGKFTLDELALILNKNVGKNVIEILNNVQDSLNDEQLKNKIEGFLQLLDKYKRYLNTYSITDILIKMYNETGLYEALRIEKQGELKCANLDNFVQIIYDFEKGETLTSLYNLIKYLDVLRNKESAGDSPKLIGENEDVVRIMTIHKSKGLEFPVVILMNTAAKYNEQDTKDKMQFDESLGIGIDIYDSNLGLTYPSIIKQAIKAKTKRTLRAEALRLLYVALTRAKEKLIVYGTVPNLDKYTAKMMEIKNKETSELIASSYNSHLKCMLQVSLNNSTNFDLKIHRLEDSNNLRTVEKTVINRNEGKLDSLNKSIDKYKVSIDEQGQELQDLKSKFVISSGIIDVNKKYTVTELKKQELCLNELKPEVLTTKVTGASYGTFIHSVIEHLDYNNITYDSVLSVVQDVIGSLGIKDKSNVNFVVQDILTMYNNLKNYLLEAKVIKNELEFVMQDGLEDIPSITLEEQTLIQGVVDMYIVTKENRHVIIDFKTDRVDREDELLERYSIQLNVYKRAIELAYATSVDGAYIYSFALKKLIEVK